ncbi:transmembrane protein 43 [Petromyzon marinus]|uniref:Transmembrane protein 43 n=1 Tax=Petromyzon marinus TaxID=7757 RepID=A0AAJ7TR76_PETMA|nr:transmembrane protein 43 [Petromyzon marinus]
MRRPPTMAHRERAAPPHTMEATGFLERMGRSAVGTAVGALLLLGAVFLLVTNEGRAVKTAAALDEGLAIVKSLPQALGSVASEFDGQLVHLSGPIRTEKPLYDPNYGVRVHAVKLRRHVEMYQWVEHDDSREYKEGSEVKREARYSYDTEWRSDVVNSRNFDKEFGHQNPSIMAVESLTAVASDARVGRLLLSAELLEKITWFRPIALLGMSPPNADTEIHDNHFYHRYHPGQYAQVGDLRVSFSSAGSSGEDGEEVSIIAKQLGEQLVAHATKSGSSLALLHPGRFSAQELFELEHHSNRQLSWALRVAGLLLMYVAIRLMVNIVHTLVDWLPLVRDLVNLGLSVFAAIGAVSLSVTVVALSWLAYHPAHAALLLLAAVTVVMVPWRLVRPQARPAQAMRSKKE